MIADLKSYPAMKDAGVPWLGQVPEHWEVLAFKRLAWFKGGAGFPVEQQGQRNLELPFFKVSDMNLLENGKVMSVWNNAVSRSTAANLGATIFPAGTIVFPKVGGAMLTNKRRVVERSCCIDNNLMGCVIRRGNPAFLLAVLQHLDFARIAKPGPVPAISEGEVREIRTALPPLPEQAAIVRFLDHVDRRMRRYIRAKQKLIKLLEEQKQAIIHRAVTRGLDPNVHLKPSGVEWLDDVPEHWEVRRTKTLFRLRTEKSGVGHGRELLSIYTHIGVRPRKDLEQKGNKASTTDDYWIVRPGDLIANKLLAWMGAIGVSRYEGVTSPAYDILMPVVELASDYYHHLFRTKLYLQQFKQRSRGIMDMRLRLYFDQLGQIPVPVPPVDEQQAIVDYYDDATEDSNLTIDQTLRQIRLLREYRIRLIADIVTGKFDVREAATRLPDEVDELEPLEEAEADTDVEADAADELDAIPEEAEA